MSYYQVGAATLIDTEDLDIIRKPIDLHRPEHAAHVGGGLNRTGVASITGTLGIILGIVWLDRVLNK